MFDKSLNIKQTLAQFITNCDFRVHLAYTVSNNETKKENILEPAWKINQEKIVKLCPTAKENRSNAKVY